eukprot:TRINITY_DN332_c0_g1_i2.p1 TRINITY_DN332_c0_g1~~TRINITY_DN332_c0_g1_i2.p1  ORF type:complete len:133 (-),score=24.77 TRINITY_DN332_c0_g1_i2:96-494(-)
MNRTYNDGSLDPITKKPRTWFSALNEYRYHPNHYFRGAPTVLKIHLALPMLIPGILTGYLAARLSTAYDKWASDHSHGHGHGHGHDDHGHGHGHGHDNDHREHHDVPVFVPISQTSTFPLESFLDSYRPKQN